MDAGAAIDLDNIPRPCLLNGDWKDDDSPFLDGHSPLTAASKYRHKQLVDGFLERGAEVKVLTKRDASALHECLYIWEQMYSDSVYLGLPKSLSEREGSESSEILSNVVDVARSLISAGAEVNDESGIGFRPINNCTCDSCGDCSIYCTTLDLSVLTGSAELVEMMLCAGAYTTTKVSIECAIRMGNLEIVSRLLDIGTPVPIEVIGSLMKNKETRSYAIPLVEKRPNIRIKREVFQQAIRLGDAFTIEFLLNTESSSLQALTYNMTEAFEKCCAEGHLDTLRLLLTKFSTSGFSISRWRGRGIELAIENGHEDVLGILLSASLDIDATVHSASVLLLALRKKNTRMIKKLLGSVSLNKKKVECWRCGRMHESNDVFIAAIELGDYHVINTLLDAGASLHTLGATNCIRGSTVCILPLTASIVAKDLILVNQFISAGAALNNPPETARSTISSGRKSRFGASECTRPAWVKPLRFNSLG
jgi:ankyrin repeat protein